MLKKIIAAALLGSLLGAGLILLRAHPQGLSAEAAVNARTPLDPDAAPEATPQATVTHWVFDSFFELPEVPEPSGLCYCPKTDTLFVVDDGAEDRQSGLYEIDLDAKLLRKLQFGKDLEGVCLDPRSGLVYVADEADERVWVIDVSGADFKILRSFTVSPLLDGQPFLTKGKNGFEGIECMADAQAPGGGYLLLLNQDDPQALVRVNLDAVDSAADQADLSMVDAWTLPDINCGEVRYDGLEDELWVSHAWQNVAEVLDPRTYETKRWEVLPGAAQEGLAFDAQHRMWIGQDLGGLARYTLKTP